MVLQVWHIYSVGFTVFDGIEIELFTMNCSYRAKHSVGPILATTQLSEARDQREVFRIDQ